MKPQVRACSVQCTRLPGTLLNGALGFEEAGMAQQNTTSVETLKAIAQAFNAHDLDGIMEFFADGCSLNMPRGPEPWGQRFIGKAAVREGLATRSGIGVSPGSRARPRAPGAGPGLRGERGPAPGRGGPDAGPRRRAFRPMALPP